MLMMTMKMKMPVKAGLVNVCSLSFGAFRWTYHSFEALDTSYLPLSYLWSIGRRGVQLMGAAVSVVAPEGPIAPAIEIDIKGLPEAIEEAVFVHEQFPVIIDPTGKANLFLKYQLGTFVKHSAYCQTDLNRALVGALIHGKTLTISFDDLTGIKSDYFTEGFFPKEVLSREELYKEEVWHTLIKAEEGDPPVDEIIISPEFVFIVVTSSDFVPPELASCMRVIKVIDKGSGHEQGNSSEMEQIAGLYGAAEIIRNSIALVEAGFDGDVDEIKEQIEKGYHIESRDGRKHTALSEAACQGHMIIIDFLISMGADPNTANDTGRTPVWRAAFNGHSACVKRLLEAGGDPDCKDNTSMEAAYDVAKTDDIRLLLNEWDRDTTSMLKAKRKEEMQAQAEARIRTSAEREEFAKQKLRCEAVELATAKDLLGLKSFFQSIIDEAEQMNTKPRVTVECRNATGQSLLSIAVQNNDVEMTEFLLTHWKNCDKERWDLAEGEMSMEAKVYKTNPNTRDLKGWSCTCIAVFHDSRACLQLLLEHGANPLLRSSYNKNAWDLAKDELDAAEKVVRSRAEIRQVLIDFDNSTASTLFGNSSAKAAGGEVCSLKDLGADGSPIAMQIEMEKEMSAKNPKKGAGGNAAKGKGNKKDTAGGGTKKKGGMAAKKK